MIVVYLIEFAAIVGMLIFLGSQIVIPALQGRALFPMFRKSHKLNEELVDVAQTAYEKELENEVKLKKSQLKKGVK